MEIKAGTILLIDHTRHGRFRAVAQYNFDTKNDEMKWYPVAVADGGTVRGMAKTWCAGDSIPCRKSLVRHIEVLEEVAV